MGPARRHRSPQPVHPGLGLVLGGGGAVGTAYLAGVLQALVDAGLDLASPDLVIGTSAGALVAAQVRLGATPAQVLALADAAPDPARPGQPAKHYEKAWAGPAGLSRRAVGASAVVARSMLRAPLPMPSPRLERWFPGGLFRVRDQDRLQEVLSERWPDKPLWLMAVDLATGRREALGRRPSHRELPLREVVLASCAVPGFYEPVHLAGRRYVDGGVRSTTSLDYAVRAGCSRVVCVVPMGYDVTARTTSGQRVLRRPAVRALARELRAAGERADDVLVIQPRQSDLAVHGTNLLRGGGNADVAAQAQEQTRLLLSTDRARRLLDL